LFLLCNDLQQDGSGNVIARFAIDDDKVGLIDYQIADIGQRDVAAFLCVIEAAIGVFRYHSG